MATEERKRYTDHLPNNVRTSRAPSYMSYMRYSINPTWNADYSDNPLGLVEKQRIAFKACLEHQSGDYHKAAVRLYTTDFCYPELKYAITADDPNACKEWGSVGNSIRTSIKYMYNDTDKAAKAGIVYRGMILSEVDKQSYQTGDQFLWPQFASSSKSEVVAKRFGNIIFEIDLQGEGLTYAVNVKSVSAYPGEEEVLFYPYSGFEVIEGYNPLTNRVKLRTYDTLKVEKKFIKETQSAI